MAETQTTVRYGVSERLDLGVAYVTGTDSVVALGNYLVLTETERRPALAVGMGIERVGGSDPAGFLVVSKNFPSKRHPSSAYVGFGLRDPEGAGARVRLDLEDLELVPVGGVTAQVARNLNASLMWDGSNAHAGLQTQWQGISIAALAVRMEEFGFIVGYSWQIGGSKRGKRSAEAEGPQ